MVLTFMHFFVESLFILKAGFSKVFEVGAKQTYTRNLILMSNVDTLISL